MRERARLRNCAVSDFDLLSSVPYLRLNPAHFAGSCANHLRRAVLGASSFSHRYSFNFFLLRPRGHTRSTRIRRPSLFAGSSYARLICRDIVLESIHLHSTVRTLPLSTPVVAVLPVSVILKIMSGEIVFDEEETSGSVRNSDIASGASGGMSAWLVRHRIAKDEEQAKYFMLGFVVVAVVSAISIVVFSGNGSSNPTPASQIRSDVLRMQAEHFNAPTP